LAMNLDIQILVYPLCKIWIFCEPKKIKYTAFCGEKMEIVKDVYKNSVN
jgi:hypothetical protein